MELKPGKNEARLVVVDGKPAVEIKLTQGQVALIDPADWEHVRHHRWYAMRARRKFYAVRQCFLHREVHGDDEAETVDHKNSERTLDNRRSNLRSGTGNQNRQNRTARGMLARKTTRYKGVFFDRAVGRFKATISQDKQRHSLGYFATAEEAAIAYDRKCWELRGEWAVLNFFYTRPVSIWS